MNYIVFNVYTPWLGRSMDDTHNDDCINKLKNRGKHKENEPKREKRDTAESILVQKSGPALAVLPDRRRRPWYRRDRKG